MAKVSLNLSKIKSFFTFKHFLNFYCVRGRSPRTLLRGNPLTGPSISGHRFPRKNSGGRWCSFKALIHLFITWLNAYFHQIITLFKWEIFANWSKFWEWDLNVGLNVSDTSKRIFVPICLYWHLSIVFLDQMTIE